MLSSTIDRPITLPAPALLARLRLTAPHTLWLGPDGLWDMGCLSAAPRAGSHPADHPADRPAQRHAHFDAWCQAHPGQACALWLSAWGVHELVVDATLPLAGDAGLLAYARPLLMHYHGEAAAHWSLATWQAAGQRGVSALHAWPLATLQASARQAGVHLRSVRPGWCQALASAMLAAPALARARVARLLVVEGRLVSDLALAQGRLVGLQQRRLADNTLAALQALVQDSPAPVWALGHGLQDTRAGKKQRTALTARTAVVLLGSLTGPAAPAHLWFGRHLPALAAMPAAAVAA